MGLSCARGREGFLKRLLMEKKKSEIMKVDVVVDESLKKNKHLWE